MPQVPVTPTNHSTCCPFKGHASYRTLCLLLASLLVIASCVAPRKEHTGSIEGPHTLSIGVHNIECCDYPLYVGVYASRSRWLKEDGMVRARIIIAEGDREVVEIHGLPEGDYAVAVYQDMNGNRQLDRWFGLVPREPYGFSNDVGRFGPPSFNSATVSIPDRTIAQTIKTSINLR